MLLNGFYDMDNNSDIKKYASDIWIILQRSYKNIGGFLTYSDIDELIYRTSLISCYFMKGVLVACPIYRNSLGGEKMVGCGTLHGLPIEKVALHKIITNDINDFLKWHWAEVSGGVEKLFKKYNGNPIPGALAPSILNKYNNFELCEDKFHYFREIDGKKIQKSIYGFKDEQIYNEVRNNILKYTGYDSYELWKSDINKIEALYESDAISITDMCINMCIQLEYLYDEYDIRELPRELYIGFSKCIKYLNKLLDKSKRISDIIRSSSYILKHITMMTMHNFKEREAKMVFPEIL